MTETDLKFGSITEIWKSKAEWSKYHAFLENMQPEAYDSEGKPVLISRYSTFLQLYVNLYHKVSEFSINFVTFLLIC